MRGGVKGNNEENRMTSISVAAEECAAFGQRRQIVESFPFETQI
jgi:hypothetical protein